MKASVAGVLIGFLVAPVTLFATGSHYVQPYVKKDGTSVQGHYRTNPDNNIYNNYSTQPNVNPYTGKEGTVNPYVTPLPSTNTVPSYNNNGYGTYNNWGNTRR